MKFYNLFFIIISICLIFSSAEKAEEVKEDTLENVEEKTKENVEEKENEFPPKAYIAELKYGTRCPEADPKHPYEVDEKITRLDFHTNSIVLDINPTIETHNYTVSHTCSPFFYVKYTKGYRFAVTSYEFRGTYHIDEGIRAVIKSDNTDALTHVFEGPAMGTFEIKDELDWTSGWNRPHHGRFENGKLWFGCRTDMIRISVGVKALLNNRLNEDGSGTLVLKDFSANIVWDKCPPEKERYIPTEEEIIKASIPQPAKKPNEDIKKEYEEKSKSTNNTKKLPEDLKKEDKKTEDENKE